MAKQRDGDGSPGDRFTWKDGEVQIISHGPKHPQVTVRLVGEDGNAFAILGRVIAAMKRAGVPAEEIEAFRAEATAGDYDALLQTVMRWVDAT